MTKIFYIAEDYPFQSKGRERLNPWRIQKLTSQLFPKNSLDFSQKLTRSKTKYRPRLLKHIATVKLEHFSHMIQSAIMKRPYVSHDVFAELRCKEAVWHTLSGRKILVFQFYFVSCAQNQKSKGVKSVTRPE